MSPGDLTATPVAPVALAVALIVFGGLLGVRSRTKRIEALNRSLHELRRPLQVLALALPELRPYALAGGADSLSPGRRRGLPHRLSSEPLRQAISALSVLDSQINGGTASLSKPRRSELVAVRLMVDACVRRWLPFARLAGAELRMVWTGPDALVRGDGTALAGALENLISNAIEHGGPSIEVSGMAIGRKIRLVVRDSGEAPSCRRETRPIPPGIGRLAQVGGHGHGLEVVRATVSEHGGKLDVEFGSDRSEAVMVLPVSSARRTGTGSVKVNW